MFTAILTVAGTLMTVAMLCLVTWEALKMLDGRRVKVRK